MGKLVQIPWWAGHVLSRRGALLLLCGLALALTGCGGGGGGGGTGGNSGQPVTVQGAVLRAETGLPPSPAVTVTIGGVSVATSAADGSFTLANVPSGATSMMIQPDTTDKNTQPRTLTVALTPIPANGIINLGTLYVSDTGYNATVTGTVVTQGTSQPVGNATVQLAGSTTVTKTDGTFTLANLPVGLGNAANEAIGQIVAAGFATKPITSETIGYPLAAGNNSIGNITIAPAVNGTTPLPPYTITGLVTVGGKVPSTGINVTIISNNNNLGTVLTDATGAFYFWVVPGTYTISAVYNGTTKQASITLNALNMPVSLKNPINF